MMEPFWEHQAPIRILTALLGLTTAVITTGIARVQSSVKSQIAHGSISQIGIIFIEVAASFETLALIHFAGNAFLRTYFISLSFIIDGLALIRIYARVFLGPHTKSIYEMAYRSS